MIQCLMTNYENHSQIVEFFARNNNFGYDSLVFFPQNMLPAINISNHEVILQAPGKISLAPNGNGGLYHSMLKHNVLGILQQEGVKFIQLTGIDNVLNKLADPLAVEVFHTNPNA